ncbi:MAG: hypothetical protein DRP55_01365 [Spirochaetes bacterium]|nr:MAG: hypothetical protein DRP55_01365 [Spirochaetota bacterium]
MTKDHEDELTKERILNEAEILFAQKGYKSVNIREITKAANCNLAAVNYYFGSKKNLYLDVFRSRWMARAKRLQEFFKSSLGSISPNSPAKIVEALAYTFLKGPLSEEERHRHHQLIAREMAQPTEALEMIIDQMIKPFIKELSDMLLPSMSKDITKEELILNILSMFAIVLYFNFARKAVTSIINRPYDSEFKTKLIEHIINFSLYGLSGSQKEELK